MNDEMYDHVKTRQQSQECTCHTGLINFEARLTFEGVHKVDSMGI